LVDNKIHQIVEACLKELQTLNRPFKYIVTCIIMQKNGAGMDTGAAMHWDANSDGLICIPWENAEMHVVLTIYGVSLNVGNADDGEE
jgi:dynein light chain Tctex-type 1